MLQKCCTNLGHSVNRIDHLVWREKIIAFEGRFAMRTTRSATLCEWPGMRRELRSVVCHFLGFSESNHTIFKLSKCCATPFWYSFESHQFQGNRGFSSTEVPISPDWSINEVDLFFLLPSARSWGKNRHRLSGPTR